MVLIIVLAWAFVESTKPLPGVEQLQNDRTHIPEGSATNYQYNPPTSGAHYPSWITKGFYDTPRADGYLVHSMEHGYVVLWYNCDKKVVSAQGIGKSGRVGWNGIVSTVYAQSANPNGAIGMTAGSEGSPSASLAQLPKSFSDGSCTSFENQIKDIMNQDNMHKLIAVPRVGIDSPLVLTAWGRSEKFNSPEKGKIKEFIDAYRDNGPENTSEP